MKKKGLFLTVLGLLVFLTSMIQAQEEMIVGFSTEDGAHDITNNSYDKLLYLHFKMPTDKAYNLSEIGVNINASSPSGNVKLAIYNDTGLLFETPELAVAGGAEYVSYSIPENTLTLTAAGFYQIAIIGTLNVLIDAQSNAVNEGTATNMSTSSYGIYDNDAINYPVFPTGVLAPDISWYRAVSLVLKGDLAPVLPTIINQPVNQSNICTGSDVSFFVNGIHIDTYQWQKDEGSGFENITNGGVYSNATTATLNITGVTEGMNNYQYRCYLTNTEGNTTSNTVILTTDTENPVPDVTPLSNVTAECEITTLTAPTASDNCAGTVTGTHDATLPITTQGTTEVTWTYDDGNANTVTQVQNVIIADVTDPTITCIENQTINLEIGQTTYTVSTTEFDPATTDDNCGIASVENDFNNTGTLASESLPTGTTTIIWTVTDNAGNTATCNFDITVNANTTAIETLKQNGISIYPNPTKGLLNFDFVNNNIQKISILNLSGKTIVEKTSNILAKESFNIQDFKSGVYLISIQTYNDVITTKIIKE